MTKQRDDIDLVEDFFDGSLNKDQVTEFEIRLKSDPAFAELYKQRLLLQKAWQSTSKYAKVRSKVKSAIREERTAMQYRRNILLVAASLVVLLGVGSVLLFILPEKSSVQLREARLAADSIQKQEINQGPQQTGGVPKYGRADTIPGSELREPVLLSPEDHEVFSHRDSIHFEWRSSFKESILFIKEKDFDSLVLRMYFQDGERVYLLQTSGLNTGTYIWYVGDPLNSREFRVNRNETK